MMNSLSRASRHILQRKSVHHGFAGGLLEHTLSVVKFCEYMAGGISDPE